MKTNEGKTQAIYFSRRPRVPEDVLKLNGRDIPFANNVTYLGVTFDRWMTWSFHIGRTAAKALGTYIKTYSLLKREHLSIDIKRTLYKALIRSILASVWPTWEYALTS
jgi:hypothetical protein